MEKINNKEAISLTISTSLGITVFISSQIIASTCLSSSLINTGYISFIALAITIIICLLYKKFIGIRYHYSRITYSSKGNYFQIFERGGIS